MTDVKDEAIAHLGMRLAQCEIDRALLTARLALAKETAAAVLEAVEWVPEIMEPSVGNEARFDSRHARIPADMLMSLQHVVTSL